MSKAFESGKSFADLVLAKLPENLREQMQTVLSAPEAADALTVLGDGVLARADYSKQMDAVRETETRLNADYANLTEWYKQRQPLLDQYDSLEKVNAAIAAAKGQPGIITPPPVTPPVDTKQFLTREEMEQRERAAVDFIGETNRLSFGHFRLFNEELDVNKVVEYAQQKRLTVRDAYASMFADQLQAKRTAEENARIDKLVTERVAAERKAQVDNPFPLRNAAPSVLDILETPADKRPQHTVDSATAEYERLVAARST